MASHTAGVLRCSRFPGVEFREKDSCLPPRCVWCPLREKCRSAASSQSQGVQRLASELSALASHTATLTDTCPSLVSSMESTVTGGVGFVSSSFPGLVPFVSERLVVGTFPFYIPMHGQVLTTVTDPGFTRSLRLHAWRFSARS